MHSAEWIIKRAIGAMVRGKRQPHCYSAHVPGRGYVNDGTIAGDDRADYLRQLERSATSELENMQSASGYAEPGYDDPEHCVLFADWNVFPRGLDTILERAGYAIEWSDEWTICEDCYKAVRTSADSYGWQMHGVYGDGYFVCLDCADWAETLETEYEDDPHKAVPARIDPADYGYVRVSEPREYESGFHPGQTDDPAVILADLHKRGINRVIFRVPTVQQFDVYFETWRKVAEETADGAEETAEPTNADRIMERIAAEDTAAESESESE